MDQDIVLENDKLFQAAAQYFNANQFVPALQILLTLESRMPDDLNVARLLANANFHTNRYAEAIACFEKLVAADDHDVRSHFFIGLCYARLGGFHNLAKSRDYLLAVLDRLPHVLDAHVEFRNYLYAILGQCAEVVGPPEVGVRAFLYNAQLSGKAEDYYSLSGLYGRAEQWEESAQALKKAAEIDPAKYKSQYEDYLKMEQGKKDGVAPKPSKVKYAVYPSTKALNGDFKAVIKKYVATDLKLVPVIVTKDTKFCVVGSCYSQDLSRAMTQIGVSNYWVRGNENVFTTNGTRFVIDWIMGSIPETDENLRRFRDATGFDEPREDVLRQMRECDVFVLTLGLAPSFFDKTTGEFAITPNNRLGRKAMQQSYDFRTTSLQENIANVIYILSFFRSLNPLSKIIISLAPTPMHMTFEFDSAITADCLSKSILRVTAHEVVHNSGLKDIYYWPTFEIFRWLTGHTKPFFGVDDTESWYVPRYLVEAELQAMLDVFSGQE